ncbi:TlpA family protein disulfide reductase [Hymenobacter terricola]|uniref:TlpA family protein disulfide reductase n=1 Tax=Hymenobacter terricola TaxID=2819236 RepID=UPI001B315858|nr:TlpA disulfide reductase family protein [Hymenobacter terricola]
MNKKYFWRGYLLGLLLTLGIGSGAVYFMFMRQPDIRLSEMGLVELDGTPVVAAQLANKPVVVNYWATWCVPCIEEFPVFEQAQKKAGAGVVFLMVSDEPPTKIQAFLKKHPYGFRFLRVRQPLPGVNVRPVTYGYDHSSALITKHSGSITAQALQALINSL